MGGRGLNELCLRRYERPRPEADDTYFFLSPHRRNRVPDGGYV